MIWIMEKLMTSLLTVRWTNGLLRMIMVIVIVFLLIIVFWCLLIFYNKLTFAILYRVIGVCDDLELSFVGADEQQ